MRKAMSKSEKVYYRIIKSHIKTDSQNYDMFSTDDQEKDWEKQEGLD